MRSLTGVLLSAGLIACASSQAKQETTLVSQTQEVVKVEGGFEVKLSREEFVTRAELPMARAAVLQLLPEVYRELGLPQPKVDQARSLVAVENHAITGSLGKERLSKYLNCGSSMTGEHADTRRIRLTVQTAADQAGADKTALQVRVDATAQALDGTSTAPMTCTSRGTLEALLVRRLRERASAAGT